MPRHGDAFLIYVNPVDPASQSIATDLADAGGVRSEPDGLVFGFPSAGQRDAAIRRIQGVYGVRSVASSRRGWFEPL